MAARPFVVPVGAILKSGVPRRETRRGRLPDLRVSGSKVPPTADVVVDVELVPVGHAIEAVGTVTAPWCGECRRCLRPVAAALMASVRELFEDNPVEEETYPLVHGEVDLEPLAREAVVLELPQAPLCREDCLGLCPNCGADRNESPCSCRPATDPRWAALDQLRTNDD